MGIDKPNIVPVIGRYLNLKRNGTNYVACCPFHNEKTVSFSVSEAKQIYKCFGCGASGDVISFVQEIEKTDFVGALKILDLGTDFQNNYTPIAPPKPAPTVQQKFFDREMVVNQLITEKNYHKNTFAWYLINRFGGTKDVNGNVITRERILSVFRNYALMLGKTDSAVWFPYIDLKKRVCNVKTMNYEVREGICSQDLKRIKDSTPYPLGKLANGYEYSCLFGTHLITPDSIICLVESEKTAIIASIFYNFPNFVFLATGSLGGINKVRFIANLDNEIRFFPDFDDHVGKQLFKEKAFELAKKGKKTRYVADYFDYLPPELREKSDLADCLIYSASRISFDSQEAKWDFALKNPKYEYLFWQDVGEIVS